MSKHAKSKSYYSRAVNDVSAPREAPVPDKRAVELDVAQHGGHVGGVALVLRGLGWRYRDVKTPKCQRHIEVANTESYNC